MWVGGTDRLAAADAPPEETWPSKVFPHAEKFTAARDLYKGRYAQILSACSGGMVTTDNEKIYQHACGMRQYGETGDLSVSSQAYQTEGIGWNYKLNEMVTALARVKLRHLNEYTVCAQQLCGQLTERLRPVEGLSAPHVPPDRTHSYYYFPVQVHPERLQLDMEPGKLRAAVMQALNAENVVVSGWQTSPIPAQLSFRKQNQPQTRSHPWNRQGREDRNGILHE